MRDSSGMQCGAGKIRRGWKKIAPRENGSSRLKTWIRAWWTHRDGVGGGGMAADQGSSGHRRSNYRSRERRIRDAVGVSGGVGVGVTATETSDVL